MPEAPTPASIVEDHPTGLATAVATLATFIAVKLGLELSPEEAVVIPGAVAVIVSYFTPRR